MEINYSRRIAGMLAQFSPVIVLMSWAWVMDMPDRGELNTEATIETIWVAGNGIGFITALAFVAAFGLLVYVTRNQSR